MMNVDDDLSAANIVNIHCIGQNAAAVEMLAPQMTLVQTNLDFHLNQIHRVYYYLLVYTLLPLWFLVLVWYGIVLVMFIFKSINTSSIFEKGN